MDDDPGYLAIQGDRGRLPMFSEEQEEGWRVTAAEDASLELVSPPRQRFPTLTVNADGVPSGAAGLRAARSSHRVRARVDADRR